MDTFDCVFWAIYWIGVIIWSLKNKEKAKAELLQIKNNWKKGIVILFLILLPFLAMVLTLYF
ncbi:hypothetical protein LCY76_16565 [Fictibacillus sp. KIGAM418]|uniref:Uncharacterized protein n=1 Tax=Fictibacillus marinisediminis TaxID=2878389 RepID=A0A9X2BDS6_9BACL|nr:hypothetical protein [Fictibacillus marinisediminis]MCK6258189.1 hypothetical protein [Fictibacillus marinisediminis]